MDDAVIKDNFGTPSGATQHLQFDIQLDTWEAINNAQRRAALAIDELEVTEFRFMEFGSEAIKKGFKIIFIF